MSEREAAIEAMMVILDRTVSSRHQLELRVDAQDMLDMPKVEAYFREKFQPDPPKEAMLTDEEIYKYRILFDKNGVLRLTWDVDGVVQAATKKALAWAEADKKRAYDEAWAAGYAQAGIDHPSVDTCDVQASVREERKRIWSQFANASFPYWRDIVDRLKAEEQK